MQLETTILKNPESVIRPVKKERIIDKRLWLTWTLVITVLLIVFSTVIGFSPYLHQDEFMTLELGRIVLDPSTSWSITWVTKISQPAFLWTYLGPVIQEYILLVFGQYGPRISSLIGAAIAATTIVGWIHSKGVNRHVSILLGLIFFLDPLYVQAYTIARIDGWAISLCIAACWLLSSKQQQAVLGGAKWWHISLSGALMAIAFFIWPSAIFLFPLVILELVSLISWNNSSDKHWKEKVVPFLLLGIGGASMSVLLLTPISSTLYDHFSNLQETIKTNTRAGVESQTFRVNYVLQQFVELLRVLKFSPFIVLFALVGLWYKRNVGLIIAFLVTLLLMASTIVYIHRVQYLLPYFLAFIAGIYQKGRNLQNASFLRVAKPMGLAVLLFWGISLSVCIRLYIAFTEREYSDRRLVYKAANTILGKGAHKVLILPYEFYYPGLSLGWHMYKPYQAHGEPFTKEELQRILPYVDYVILNHVEHLQPGFIQELEKEGLQDAGDYALYQEPAPKFNGVTTNNHRFRNLYSVFKKPYGPYKLYKRVDLKSTEQL